MAVIFEIEHKSDQDRDYKCEIIDNDGGSFIGDIIVNSDGFRLEDTGDNKDFHQTIIGKALSFTIQVTNNDIENFITSLTTSDEGRYLAKLYLGTDVIFIGVITTDNVTIDNAPKPYDFKLEAVDGVKLLKNKTYPDILIPRFSRTIQDIIMASFSKLTTLSEYGISDSFLGVALDWWSKEHIDDSQDSGNVFAKTHVSNFTFTKKQDTQGIEQRVYEARYINCLDVIKSILESFNCRLYYDNGFYHIEQFGVRTSTSYSEVIYNRPSTGLLSYSELTTDTITPAVDINQLDNFHLAGGKIKLLPPLNNVNITFNLDLDQGFLPTDEEFNQDRVQDLETLGTFVQTDQTDTLNFLLEIESRFLGGNVALIESRRVGWKVIIIVGDEILTNLSNGNMEWVSYSSNPDTFLALGFGVDEFVDEDGFSAQLPLFLQQVGSLFTYTTTFTTPEVTEDGDVKFNIMPVYRYWDGTQYIYEEESELPLSITHNWSVVDSDLVQTVDGETAIRIPKTVTSSQEDGTQGLNRSVLLGDGYTVGRPGVMAIKETSSGDYKKTTGWKIGTGSGSYIKHSQLLAQTILSERLKVLRIYQGVFYAKTNFLSIANTFKYDGFDLLTNKTNLKTNYDEITTELIEISTDTTGITNEELETQVEFNEEVSTGGGSQGGGNNNDINDPPNEGRDGLITSETIYADVAITSVPILEADDDYFVTGDEIIIKDNITGYEHKVTVAAPLGQGDTSITIESYTPSLNIAIYSAITFAPGQLLNLRPKYQRFNDATGSSVTITNFTLPDETSLSDDEMSRRLRVFRQTSKIIYNVGFTVDSTNNKIDFAWDLQDEYVEVELL